MTLDARAVRAWRFAPIETAWTQRDTMLYALGLGLGIDPLDRDRLRFVWERDLVALPTMAGILGYPGLWLADPSTGVDALRTVHGEQWIALHRPLAAAGRAVGRNRVVAVVDKGAGRGALVVTERTLHDAADGEPIATLRHTAFCRADGGFAARGVASDPAPPAPPAVPGRAPDAVVEHATRPESALVYRLSGDRSPIHVDPDAARAAGFERPILHGMASFGIVGVAVLQAFCDLDPSRLHEIGARFRAPVLPGETIVTELWRGAPVGGRRPVQFRARVAGRGTVVVDGGLAMVD